MPTTYYPNKKQYYKARLNSAIRWIIPRWIKTEPILQLSDDKQVAIEKIGYMFGWNWKTWKWTKLTGRIFKRASEQLPTPEEALDHYALTGEDLLQPRQQNTVIVYAQEDFTPCAYELYMTA